jgi:hypothetical protein
MLDMGFNRTRTPVRGELVEPLAQGFDKLSPNGLPTRLNAVPYESVTPRADARPSATPI